jgi:hypothetical protein
MDWVSFGKGIWLGGAVAHFAFLLFEKKIIFPLKVVGAILWPIGMIGVIYSKRNHETRS